MEEFNYKKEIEDILKNYKEAIKEVVETELKEEVKKVVIESKQAILDGIKPAFANIGAEIAKAMKELKAINLKVKELRLDRRRR